MQRQKTLRLFLRSGAAIARFTLSIGIGSMLLGCGSMQRKFQPLTNCRFAQGASSGPVVRCEASDGTITLYPLDSPQVPDLICIPGVQFKNFNETCRKP